MAKENIVIEKSYAFALRIIKLYKYLADTHKEYVISKQVLRSGTAIGALLSELVYAQSKADFINKAHVALKGVTAAITSHTYKCTLVPEQKQTDLYPGMVCKVRLSEVSDSLRIRIPASSVEMDSNGKFVWVVKDGVVGRNYVTISGYQDQGVVVSSGLEPGDKVIVKGAAKVSTGMKVNSVEQAF